MWYMCAYVFVCGFSADVLSTAEGGLDSFYEDGGEEGEYYEVGLLLFINI